jgi:hypothetical protein
MDEVNVIMTILGAGLCLGGWAIYWVGTRLIAMAFGLAMGFAFGQFVILSLGVNTDASNLILLSCTGLGAVAGLLLVRPVTTFLFVLAGFAFGVLLGRVGSQVYFMIQGWKFEFTTTVAGIILGSAAVFAALACFLQKYIMIVITSFIGAHFLVLCIPALSEPRWQPYAFSALMIASCAWQILFVTKLAVDKPRRQTE